MTSSTDESGPDDTQRQLQPETDHPNAQPEKIEPLKTAPASEPSLEDEPDDDNTDQGEQFHDS